MFLIIATISFAQESAISISSKDNLFVEPKLEIASSTETNNNLYWKPKLEYAFTHTFSSSHEFAACQLFQKLDYDLAEIAEIRKITPFPATLTVEVDGITEESVMIQNSENATESKILKFKILTVNCEKVHYFDMIVEKVKFSFPDSSVELDYLDKGRLKFFSASKIGLEILVSESDILEVLKLYPKAKALSGVKVTLSPNKCSSKGRVKLGILVAEFKFNGHLNQISPKKVNFVCDKLTINSIPQPRAFVKSIMNYVNPVYDSSKIWINLNVENMKLIKGFVETKASIEKKVRVNAN